MAATVGRAKPSMRFRPSAKPTTPRKLSGFRNTLKAMNGVRKTFGRLFARGGEGIDADGVRKSTARACSRDCAQSD